MSAETTVSDRLDALAAVPTESAAERAVLLAAVRWHHPRDGIFVALWKWAKLAGVSARTLQRILRALEARGIIRLVEASVGGRKSIGERRNTATYLILPLAENPDATPGIPSLQNPDGDDNKPRRARRKTPTAAPETPTPRRTNLTNRVNQNTTPPVGGGVWELPAELKGHPNATPERVEWIKREIASGRVKIPAAWAERAILENWKPTAETAEERAVRGRLEFQRLIEAFERLPETDQKAILSQIHMEHPNTSGESHCTDRMRHLIAKAMTRRTG